ncbi:MAG: SGNH/GDSL hydrolase family protein [Zavarzinella sp.]|nr:SGNH/GDSL hydrolase family protein [Zavarzinella sp.]
MSDTGAKAERQGRFWGELAFAGLVVLAVLAIIDQFVRRAVEPKVIDRVVDIQTESALKAKLDRLEAFHGKRVVLIGDSVVLGLTLKDTGDPQWESKTITAQLRRRLEEAFPGEPVLVANLALNGALPADLDRLVELVLPARPDLIILDVGLRGFSADFTGPGTVHSRDWLNRTGATKRARGMERLLGATRKGIDRGINEPVRRRWRLLNLRDLAAQALLGADVRQALVRQREALRVALAALYQDPMDDLGADELELVLKARTRLESVHLGEDNPQRQALVTMLSRIQAANQPTLIFYARENPELRDQVLRPERYYDLRTELDALITAHLGSQVRYVPGVPSLDADRYLDLVHVDAEGFRRVVDALWPEIEAVMAGRISLAGP